MIFYYPHIFLIRDLCVLIVSLVHRACLIGHNEEETSKPLLFSTCTWSKFETSNPDRLVGPLKFDKLFIAQNPNLLCSALCEFQISKPVVANSLSVGGSMEQRQLWAQNCSPT
jgi:hypothetical protein